MVKKKYLFIGLCSLLIYIISITKEEMTFKVLPECIGGWKQLEDIPNL